MENYPFTPPYLEHWRSPVSQSMGCMGTFGCHHFHQWRNGSVKDGHTCSMVALEL